MFGKVIRTTAFRLTVVYLLMFVLFAVSLVGYFAWNTRRMITEQITETVNAEIAELRQLHSEGGLRGLVNAIEGRALRPGANLYMITTSAGQAVAGNIAALDPGAMGRIGWTEIIYQRLDDPDQNPDHDHRALARVFDVPGGFRVLVGRDLEERRRLFSIVVSAARWSFVVVIGLGLAGGVYAARRVLRRIDAMTGTTRRIMAGDLSERLPIGRSGDELDRLAASLNAMLERIEALMRGVKEVSDNIAHDLKTPLTRLRNRCEQALAARGDEAAYRAALEQTIEESDSLIRTFNALLMIARAESGQARDDLKDFDAAGVARDIFELYEPLAEEHGLTMAVKADAAATVRGNRELVSQALANLVENAIKYGASRERPAAPGGPAAAVAITIEASRAGDAVLLSVADHGPGIPEADRKRAVDRFVRLEVSRTLPGSGLGLSLASAVATLHGGELRLADNNPGLRAVLALPVRGPELNVHEASRSGERGH
jgi:hypothetical protein